MASASAVEITCNGSSTLVTARASLEEAIMDANQNKYRLAHDATLIQEQHIYLIGVFRESPEIVSMLVLW